MQQRCHPAVAVASVLLGQHDDVVGERTFHWPCEFNVVESTKIGKGGENVEARQRGSIFFASSGSVSVGAAVPETANWTMMILGMARLVLRCGVVVAARRFPTPLNPSRDW
jgi:hypothetical protein